MELEGAASSMNNAITRDARASIRWQRPIRGKARGKRSASRCTER